MPVKIEKSEKPSINKDVNTKSLSKVRTVVDKKMPDVESMFDDNDTTPVDLVLEAGDAASVHAQVKKATDEEYRKIMEKKKSSDERYRLDFNDTSYYFVVIFQSTEQKDEFLDKTNWAPPGDTFVSGLALAQKLNLGVKYIPLEALPMRGNPKRYKGMVLKKEISKKGE